MHSRPVRSDAVCGRRGLREKLHDCRGFSIGEILLAILIMLLLTGVLTATVSLCSGRYRTTISRSEANTLSSTLQSIMTNELAYTTKLRKETQDEKEILVFQSQNYAVSKNLSHFFVDEGRVMIGGEGTGEESLMLLGEGAYPNGLRVENLEVTYDEASYTFTVSFDITRDGAATPVLSQKFQVINVNRTGIQ